MLYIPNMWINHFLKDDSLLISYGGRIEPNPDYATDPCREKYVGWDERVWGNSILEILKGAEKYAGYDIKPFAAQVKEKLAALKKTIQTSLVITSSMSINGCMSHMKWNAENGDNERWQISILRICILGMQMSFGLTIAPLQI